MRKRTAISPHGDARGDEVADAAGGALGLGRFVAVLDVLRFGPGVALGDEFQPVVGGAAAGLGEQSVGQVDDLRGGAVVADQLDHGRLGVADPEVQQVLGGGAGERVDRLAGVADDAEAVAVPQPEFEEALLEGADVLVLVDDEVLVLGADVVGDVPAVLEDADGEEQDVLEVDDAPVPLELFVAGVDLGQFGRVAGGVALAFGDALRVVAGDGLGDLGPLDLAGGVAELVAVEADAAGRARLCDQLGLAFDEAWECPADGFRPEVLELAQGGGVEGAGLHAAGDRVGGGGRASRRRRGW